MAAEKKVDSVNNIGEDTKEEKKIQPVPFSRLFRYADAVDWTLLVTGAILATGAGLAMPLFSVILGGLFDAFNGNGDILEEASYYSIVFAITGFAVFVASFAQVGFFTISAERQAIRLREVYLEAVLRQDIAWFDTTNSGELSSKIAENTVIIKESMAEKLGNLFNFSAMFIGGFGVGFAYSWQLTLVICACAPLLAIGGALMMKFMSDLTSDGLGAYAAAGGVAEEAISMIRTVAGLGAEKRVAAKYDDKLVEAEEAGIQKARAQGLGMGFTMGVYFALYAVAFWYGSVLIDDSRVDAAKNYPVDQAYLNATGITWCQIGTVPPAEELGFYNQSICAGKTLESESDICGCFECQCGCYSPNANVDTCVSGGDIVLVFFAVVIGSFALGQATPSLTAITNGKSAGGVIYDIIDRKPVVDNDSGNKEKPGTVVGAIQLKNVKFAYPSRMEQMIFNNLTLDIPAGKSCALVGGSGCGKSTIVALVERYYDPLQGSVELDGKNLKDLDVQWLRNQIGLVGQEPVLFATTIAQNIAYGVLDGGDTSQAAIERAAKSANAHDFISSFPQGYQTLVGEKGAQLSGGQKQRIAIARSIIRDPSILLLDEATSALDNESEHIVQEALDKLLEMKKRTTIMIAHRLSTIRNADKIVVLEKGDILEQGSHDELVKIENGHYAMLVDATNKIKTQTGKDDIDVEDIVNVMEQERRNSTDVTTDSVLERIASSGANFEDKSMRKKSNAAMVAPEETAPKKDEEIKKVGVNRLWEFSRNEKCLYIPGILCAAINGAQMPVFAVLFADIVTAFYVPTRKELIDEVSYYCILFVIFAIIVFFGNFGQTYSFGVIGEKMTTRIRRKLFGHVIHQDVGYFDLPEHSTGALTTYLSQDAALVKAALSDRLGVYTMNLFTSVIGLTIAFVEGWELSLVLLGLFPIMAISGVLQMKAMGGFASEDSDAMAMSGQVLGESIAGIRTVAAFGLRGKVVDLYKSLLEGPKKLGAKKGILGGLGFGFSQGVMFWSYSVAFYYGGYLISTGQYTFNQMLAVFFAIMMSAMGLGQAASMAPDIGKAASATSNVFKILDHPSKIDASNPNGKRLDSVSGDLELANVQFAYPSRPDAKVFDDMSLKIDAGTTVAFVGASGSGKSTVIQLLERFYDPAKGSMKFDGKDIKELNVEWYRSQIGLVSQEPNLFKGTIAENISYGVPGGQPTMAEIEQAAKSANAHDFITSFPGGYDTSVGDQGAQLSGGQKQRIAIARAIIRDPAVLLLDEATSALDNVSERVVQEALDDLMKVKKRTTVIVAHRLSTIKNANCIVVVDQGKIVEKGTHDELMSTGVYYPKLYNRQKQQED